MAPFPSALLARPLRLWGPSYPVLCLRRSMSLCPCLVTLSFSLSCGHPDLHCLASFQTGLWPPCPHPCVCGGMEPCTPHWLHDLICPSILSTLVSCPHCPEAAWKLPLFSPAFLLKTGGHAVSWQPSPLLCSPGPCACGFLYCPVLCLRRSMKLCPCLF